MSLLATRHPEPRTPHARALVFEDPASLELLERVRLVAPSDATVLVQGETGTGKELVARHLHALSRRAARPFVAVNCGALPEALLDSELFGHDRGAFTGATSARGGWFEAAEGGTLFLDEIGELSLQAQVRLLRVLQEREIVRVGTRQPIPVDVRVIAATHVDLREAVEAGRFREDLFYRLSVATLRVPALRERQGDIPHLVERFLAEYRYRLGVGAVELAPDAIDALLAHPWPGNVRELENVIHHALLVCPTGPIRARDLALAPGRVSAGAAGAPPGGLPALERVLTALLEEEIPELHARVEETLIRTAYQHAEANQVQAARLLGMSRNVLRARLAGYGLAPPRGPRGSRR
jgi:sigma-54-specific transcriptional regulator